MKVSIVALVIASAMSIPAMAYEVPPVQINVPSPIATPRLAINAPMLESRRARMEQMIAGMKAQGVTKEQAQRSVNAFLANGKWQEARMIVEAFGL